MSQKSEKPARGDMLRGDMLRGDLVGGRGYRKGPSSGWVLVEEPTGCRMVFFSYILLPAQLSQTPGRRRHSRTVRPCHGVHEISDEAMGCRARVRRRRPLQTGEVGVKSSCQRLKTVSRARKLVSCSSCRRRRGERDRGSRTVKTPPRCSWRCEGQQARSTAFLFSSFFSP